MTTDSERAESLLGFEEHRRLWAKATNLSDGERELVYETRLIASRGYLRSQGADIPLRAMTPSQKNAKRGLKQKLIAGRRDLLHASDLFGPMQQKLRFKLADLVEIYDANDIAEVVRLSASGLGKDRKGNDLGKAFADTILYALKDFYAGRGERLVVHRDVGENPTWWNPEVLRNKPTQPRKVQRGRSRVQKGRRTVQ